MEPETLQEHYYPMGGGYGDLDGTYDLGQESVAFRSTSYQTNPYDRLEGRYLPVYHTENDLRIINQMARLLQTRVPAARALLERLLDYTIGTGFDWKISDPDNELLAKAATKVIDRWMKENKWDEAWERASFETSVGEGEFLAELTIEDGGIGLLAFTGDQLVEPSNTRELEDYYYELQRYAPLNWRFGVVTNYLRTDKPLGYHVHRDETNYNWEFIWASRMLQWKRNVWPKAKRGVNDFYTPHIYLGRADKVSANTGEGAAIQAAIGYIVEHVPGATAKQVNKIIGSLVNAQGINPVTGQSENRRVVRPGQRVDIPQGMKYHAAPLGQPHSNIYIEVMESMLRLAASIYGMPEHMITGSAENNNLASIKEAGSPFIQGRKADQKIRGEQLKEMILKILLLARKIGWLKADKEAIKNLEIAVSPPDIFQQEGKELTEELMMQVQGGLVSKQTASNKLGYEWDDEKQLMAEEAETAAKTGLNPNDPLGMSPDAEDPTDPQDGGGEPPGGPDDEGPPDAPGPDEVERESLSERQKLLVDAWRDYDTVVENCGTGAGGFQQGNTCATGGSSSGGGPSSDSGKPKLTSSGILPMKGEDVSNEAAHKAGLASPRDREKMAQIVDAEAEADMKKKEVRGIRKTLRLMGNGDPDAAEGPGADELRSKLETASKEYMDLEGVVSKLEGELLEKATSPDKLRDAINMAHEDNIHKNRLALLQPGMDLNDSRILSLDFYADTWGPYEGPTRDKFDKVMTQHLGGGEKVKPNDLAPYSAVELEEIRKHIQPHSQLDTAIVTELETRISGEREAKLNKMQDRALEFTSNEAPGEFAKSFTSAMNEGNKKADGMINQIVGADVAENGRVWASNEKRAQVKQDIAKRVGARVATKVDEERLEMYALAQGGHGVRMAYQDNLSKGMSKAEAAGDAIVADMNRAWADSSTNGNETSVMFQKAVARKFGLNENIASADDRTQLNAEERLDATSDVISAVVDSVYEETQQHLADSGIKEVALFRGMKLYEQGIGSEQRKNEGYQAAMDIIRSRHTLHGNVPSSKGDGSFFPKDYVVDVDIQGNPISSWTTDGETGRGFSQGGDYQMLLMKTVPASQVYATSVTGPGCLNEAEYLVMPGGHGKAYSTETTLPDHDKILDALPNTGTKFKRSEYRVDPTKTDKGEEYPF